MSIDAAEVGHSARVRVDPLDLVLVARKYWWALIAIGLAVGAAAFFLNTGGAPYRAAVVLPVNGDFTRVELTEMVDSLAGEQASRAIRLTGKTMTIARSAPSRDEAIADVQNVLNVLSEVSVVRPARQEVIERHLAQNARRNEVFSRVFWAMSQQIEEAAVRDMTSPSDERANAAQMLIEIDNRITELYGSRVRLEEELAQKVIATSKYDITVTGGPKPVSSAVSAGVLAGLAALVAAYLVLVGWTLWRTYARSRVTASAA